MIRRIAGDPQYTGQARAFHVTRENGKEVKRSEEEHILLPDGVIPPLVSLDDFADV